MASFTIKIKGTKRIFLSSFRLSLTKGMSGWDEGQKQIFVTSPRERL